MRQRERAAAEYEALLRLFPDDLWAGRNLGVAYARSGRAEGAIDSFWMRLAEQWPNSAQVSSRVAQAALFNGADHAQTQAALEHARSLASPISDEGTWLDLAPAFLAWLDSDAPRTVKELRRAQAARQGPGDMPEVFARRVGQFELALERRRV